MPTPKGHSSGHQKASGGRQATLSFNHRVVKAAASKQSPKELLAKKQQTDATKKARAASPATPEESLAETDETVSVKRPATNEVEDDQSIGRQDAEGGGISEDFSSKTALKSEIEVEAEAEAATISTSRIRRYWKEIESQRMAPRLHQRDLELGDKVLHYFDVSSQYGPCIGIARKKRWMRAQRLGLAPPIEVLAVLLERDRSDSSSERAYIDEILNPTIVA